MGAGEGAGAGAGAGKRKAGNWTRRIRNGTSAPLASGGSGGRGRERGREKRRAGSGELGTARPHRWRVGAVGEADEGGGEEECVWGAGSGAVRSEEGE